MTRLALVCPCCLAPWTASTGVCSCGMEYAVDPTGRPDLRVRRTVDLKLSYRYDPEWGQFPWHLSATHFSEVVGHHDGTALENTERQVLLAVPPASGEATSIDLGCGRARQRFAAPLAHLGYRHVGVDIEGPAPDVLADLHLLPFPDGYFDLLVTSAVFEHLKSPHVAIAEAARVSREGALFVGTIAFGEPCHISYFHHSPLAVHELLVCSGFVPEQYVLSADWHAFRAHLEMGYAGARWPRWFRRFAAGSFAALGLAPGFVRSRFLGQADRWEQDRLAFARSHAALVGFVARRRGPALTRLGRPATATR